MSNYTYPYADRDLFVEPERYYYAKCQNESFFDAWLYSREAVRNKIKIYIADKNKVINESNKSNMLCDMIDEIFHGMSNQLVTERKLDPLVKKFEVFRRLHINYDEEFKATNGSKLAGLTEYLKFCGLLIEYIERYGSLKFLSTLLKLMDAICSVDENNFQYEEAELCLSLIEQEKKLLLNLLESNT